MEKKKTSQCDKCIKNRCVLFGRQRKTHWPRVLKPHSPLQTVKVPCRNVTHDMIYSTRPGWISRGFHAHWWGQPMDVGPNLTSLHKKQHGVASQRGNTVRLCVHVVMFGSAAIVFSSQFEQTLHQIRLECLGMNQNDGPRLRQWKTIQSCILTLTRVTGTCGWRLELCRCVYLVPKCLKSQSAGARGATRPTPHVYLYVPCAPKPGAICYWPMPNEAHYTEFDRIQIHHWSTQTA